jgi:hypothetical protein
MGTQPHQRGQQVLADLGFARPGHCRKLSTQDGCDERGKHLNNRGALRHIARPVLCYLVQFENWRGNRIHAVW